MKKKEERPEEGVTVIAPTEGFSGTCGPSRPSLLIPNAEV